MAFARGAPQEPPLEYDASTDPADLRRTIKDLRAYAKWFVYTLAATQTAHDALAERAATSEHLRYQARSQASGDEDAAAVIASLRSQLARTQAERDEARQQRDEQASTVRDLRLRFSDSRKAFMRLQTEGENNRKTLADRRRSNPGTGAPALLLAQASPNLIATSESVAEEEDKSEMKAKRTSKRASLAFGPNGTISLAASRNLGRNPHARSPSSLTPASPMSSEMGTNRKLRRLSLVSGPSGSVTPSLPSVPYRTPTSFQFSADEPRSSLVGLGLGIRSSEPWANAGTSRSSHHRTSSNTSSGSNFSSSLLPLSPSLISTTSSRAPSPRPPPSSASAIQAKVAPEADEAVDVARRRSRMLGTGSILDSTPTPMSNTASVERLNAQLNARSTEVERLRLEMRQIRNELEQTREARDAAEVVLGSLREFIARTPPDQDASDLTTSSRTSSVTSSTRSSTSAANRNRSSVPPQAKVDGSATSYENQPVHLVRQSSGMWQNKLGSMWRRATTTATPTAAEGQ